MSGKIQGVEFTDLVPVNISGRIVLHYVIWLIG